MSPRRTKLWQTLAGLTIGLGLWYLHWRWTSSLNADAMVFSILVASTETLALIGTMLFYYDIWEEGDTPQQPPPRTRTEACLEDDEGNVTVDIYITTYDEDLDVVSPTLLAAKEVRVPAAVQTRIYLLDDGNRPQMAALARNMDVRYLTRTTNEGFKAGNLRNALMRTSGDFILICDADTRLEPTYLENTLGYFRAAEVAWVQTPHWFYDIPQGVSWKRWLTAHLGRSGAWLAPVMPYITGRQRVGQDPFLSDGSLFFDVIQRRRNRNAASFCCGAGSIHRREAVFAAALKQKEHELQQITKRLPKERDLTKDLLPSVQLQPFRFHVSEDIYTSILLHEDQETAWRSVFHPHPEARMLSPWSLEAWATQKLKYAGGTIDIMLRDNPVFRRGMKLRTKLHYAATFWSYLSALWLPVFLLAPVFSLITGIAPVEAYSSTFFLHFLPLVFVGEIAMLVGCKSLAIQPGRILALSTLPIQLRAFWMVLRGQRPKFPPTPKTPVFGDGFRHLLPNIVLLGLMAGAGIAGIVQTQIGVPGHDRSLLIVNLFWLAWNMCAVGRIVLAALWSPSLEIGSKPAEKSHKPEVENVHQLFLS